MEDKPKVSGPIYCSRVGFEDFECGVAYWPNYQQTDKDCEICSRLNIALALADIVKALKEQNKGSLK